MYRISRCTNIDYIRTINICFQIGHFVILLRVIPSFRYRDNSVHLNESSPFWVGIFVTLNKENYPIEIFLK